MKLIPKILLTIFVIMLGLVQIAYVLALPADYYVKDVIDISAHLTNPQALEWIPGGFIVIDWESAATTNLYVLDSDGNLMNESNLSIAAKINMTRNATHLGLRITGIRVFNNSGTDFTYIVLDDSNKNFTTLNSSSFVRIDSEFRMSPGAFSSTDNLVGICTNKSDSWIATADRDVITHIGGAGNNSVNQSEVDIPGTDSTGGIDCFDGNRSLIILDDTSALVYIISPPSTVLDYVNLSSLSGRGLNTFSDIALATDPSIHRPDFYALNNATKLIYHIMKRPPSVLNVFAPAVSWTYPARNQVFNSRFATQDISFNFTLLQPNSSYSEWTDADEMNCSIFINETYNITTLIQDNNVSKIYEINVSSFSPGHYRIRLDCMANISYAKAASEFRFINVNTYKHIFWMGDNFTMWYDSDTSEFKAALGFNMTFNNSVATEKEMAAAFNITTDEPVAIRIVWNNATGNRSIYINGELKVSDLHYGWSTDRLDKIYFLSRNDTGQANAVLSYVQTSLDSTGSGYSVGTFITSWKSAFENLVDRFSLSSYFYQFKAVLRRGLSSEKPILRFVNISFDDTLMNFSLGKDMDFLDFSFSSGTSVSIPANQLSTNPSFTIWNIGNKSFSLQAASLTPFDSCFTVPLFNASSSLTISNFNRTNNNDTTNTINLSTSPQTIVSLGPGKNANVWLNVTASGCTARSEFFDIEFTTSP